MRRHGGGRRGSGAAWDQILRETDDARQFVVVGKRRATGTRWGSAAHRSRTSLQCVWASARRWRRLGSTLMRISQGPGPRLGVGPEAALAGEDRGAQLGLAAVVDGGTFRSVTQG
jgi:hypothetical protein